MLAGECTGTFRVLPPSKGAPLKRNILLRDHVGAPLSPTCAAQIGNVAHDIACSRANEKAPFVVSALAAALTPACPLAQPLRETKRIGWLTAQGPASTVMTNGDMSEW